MIRFMELEALDVPVMALRETLKDYCDSLVKAEQAEQATRASQSLSERF